MPSLQELLDELILRLKTSDRFNPRGEDPIYYIVFPAEQMLEMKRGLKLYTSRLVHEGWNPHIVSLAKVVNEILQTDNDRDIILEAEKHYLEEGDLSSINNSIRSMLVGSDPYTDRVTQRVLTEIDALKGKKDAILILSDVEALHPYLRIGAVERRLQGKCPIPVVILYPGNRTGTSTLQFLGIWPDDGNYRSTHIG